jgi:O-antigen/teichoic acid export membrane protein
MSLASILSVIATGRYELAIMLPKKNEDAANIVFLSILLSILVSFVAFFIILIFNNSITNLLGNPKISKWLYFIPITVLFTGLYQAFNYWSNRTKKYKRMAASRVIQSTGTVSANLGMGFNGFSSSGLIIGRLFGQALATCILAKIIWKEDSEILKYFNRMRIYALARKYKKLPMINLPNAIIDGFRLSGINILIAKFFTTSTLGQFSLAWRMVQTPMALIGGSLSQVFFQEVASSEKKDLFSIAKKYIINGSIIASPLFILIYLFSVDIFIFVFGDEWMLAGKTASILAPWLFLNFLTSPLSTLFIVLNKQEVLLIFGILYMIIPLSVIFIFKELAFIYILNILSFSMSIMLLIFIFLILYETGKINK